MAICLLLKENPQLPLQFIFKDECLIEKLKKERKEIADRLAVPNEDLVNLKFETDTEPHSMDI